MSDPLTDAANAISSSSPKVRAFAQLAAQRIIALEAKPTPPPPTPPPLFTQGYSAAEMQALLTAGDLIRVAADRLTAPDASHARFEVRAGDQYGGWSGERAQIQLPALQGNEGDRWRWSVPFVLAAGFTFSDGFYSVLWEHHHTGSTGSPPFTVQLHASRVVMRVTTDSTPGNDWTEYDLGPATPGLWQLLTVDHLLSADPVKASTVCTLDGNGPASAPNHRNMYAGLAVYPMWGLYRAPSPLTQVVTFGPIARLA